MLVTARPAVELEAPGLSLRFGHVRMVRRAAGVVDKTSLPQTKRRPHRVGGGRHGYAAAHVTHAVLLAALTDEPVSTSELYDRVGYLALARVSLIPYPAFRAELEKLSAAGLATGDGRRRLDAVGQPP